MADRQGSVKTEHSAIAVEIHSLEKQQRGPSFRKFGNSLLTDTKNVGLINDNIPIWFEEAKEVTDVRENWDWLKFRIMIQCYKLQKTNS